MRKVIFLSLLFLSLVILALRFGSGPLLKYLNLTDRAGLRVQANPQSSVLINQQEVGKTPFQTEDLIAGEHLVEVKSDKGGWQGYVKLQKGTLAVINRELSPNQATGSGEVITLEKGRGVMVISNPDGSEVEIDSKSYGKTPIIIEEIESGEHLFLIGHSNYLKRSIRAVVAEGFRLNLYVDLAISEVDLTKISTVPIQSTSEVVVKKTPTGFLRVRAQASVASAEIARVVPGETLVLLEELPNWGRVRLSDGQEGYVASSYVEKKLP